MRSVIPFIKGNRVLEIGHGPGHLQRVLLTLRHGSGQGRGLFTVGIDESAQMGRLAKRNLAREALSLSAPQSDLPPGSQIGNPQLHLTRGVAQSLPFRDGSFDTVVATFPTEYIFEPSTLLEAWRTLAPKGRFVLLPGAVITGRGLWERFMAWIFRITGQTPPNLTEILHERSKEPFGRAGFDLEIHEVDVKSSLVFILVATKTRIIGDAEYA